MIQATLAGFEIEIDSNGITDTFEKGIAQYEFPFVDGAKLDDLGMKARTISCTAHFYNDRYTEHEYFLAAISERFLTEMVHPQYGIIQGRCKSIRTIHNDHERHVEVQIEFVEELFNPEFASVPADITHDVFVMYTTSAQSATESLADKIRRNIREARAFVTQPATVGVSFINQFTGVTESTKSFLGACDAYTSVVDQYASAIELTNDTAAKTLSLPVTLPGIMVSKTYEAAARIALSTKLSFSKSPFAYLKNLKAALASFGDLFKSDPNGFNTIVNGAIASTLTNETAIELTTDTERRESRKSAMSAPSFDYNGRRVVTTIPERPMTRTELETVVWNACDLINTAMASDRSIDGLQTMAEGLNSYLRMVSIKYQLLALREYKSPVPLHAICLSEGLHYNEAELILEVNPSIRDPQYSSGNLYVPVRS
jgi:prophage DNA circulation protein